MNRVPPRSVSLTRSQLLLVLLFLPRLLAQPDCPSIAQATCPPNELGSWSPPFAHNPAGWGQYAPQGCTPQICFNAIHLMVIPAGPDAGKVLAFDRTYLQPPGSPPNTSYQRWSIFDPLQAPPITFHNFALPIVQNEPTIHDLFCAGHAWMADGKLFVAGGTKYLTASTYEGAKFAYLFDPFFPTRGNGQWTRLADMEKPRWYPTVTLLGDQSNRIIVSGGFRRWPHGSSPPNRYADDDAVNTYECWNPSLPLPLNKWESTGTPTRYWFKGPRWQDPDPVNGWNYGAIQPLDEYPRLFVLSNLAYNGQYGSRLFMGGMRGQSAGLDHATTPELWNSSQPWQRQPGKKVYGSAVLVPESPDMVMHVGGQIGSTITNNVEYVNNRAPPAQVSWVQSSDPGGIPPMAFARTECDAVLLPDGSVLVLGGRGNTSYGVRNPERYRDGTWCTLPAEDSPRSYHRTAVLLRDGSVLSAGGESYPPCIGRTWDYQVYSPSYVTDPNRPTWVAWPSTLQYGFTYQIKHGALPPGVIIDKVILIAPGSVTHHSDMHQRYVSMKAEADPESDIPAIRITAPSDATHAPRGYYMMFLVTNGRVPSVAQFVKLQD